MVNMGLFDFFAGKHPMRNEELRIYGGWRIPRVSKNNYDMATIPNASRVQSFYYNEEYAVVLYDVHFNGNDICGKYEGTFSQDDVNENCIHLDLERKFCLGYHNVETGEFFDETNKGKKFERVAVIRRESNHKRDRDNGFATEIIILNP